MPRPISSAMQTAIHARATDEVFLVLLTIDHEDLPVAERYVNNTEDITSNGRVFTAYPFSVTLPDQDPEKPPEVTLVLDNVAQDIIITLRSFSSPLSIDLEVVMASDPDTIEIGPLSLEVMNADWDAGVITCRISYPELLDEPVPFDTYSPALFPGMFK